MKKIFLILVVVFGTITGYSQTEKGKKIIGGQFSLNGNTFSSHDSVNSSDQSSFGIRIIPGLGYFIRDNFAIGTDLIVGFNKENNNYSYSNTQPWSRKTNSLFYGVGGFARYYKKITDNFYFVLNGRISYLHQNTETVNSDYSPYLSTYAPRKTLTNLNSFSIGVSPGLVYFITPKLGMQASFGNLYFNKTVAVNKALDNHYNRTNYGADFNISSFSLGLSYYF